ncbi:MAG: GNAT family N-acetyltransferase [Lachnospiraceae bacterium]|nr:GNAT family N-acetyltransferase [Lachnospiraceae bacterium]
MVRLAKENDLENILELYLSLHEKTIPEDCEKRERVYAHILEDKNYNLIVNEVDGVIVSSCTCLIVPNLTRNLSSYALVENVVTKKEYEGNGYARECLKYAEQIAKDNDCYKMMLITGSKEERTHSFYKSLGYSSEGKTAYVNKLREV